MELTHSSNPAIPLGSWTVAGIFLLAALYILVLKKNCLTTLFGPPSVILPPDFNKIVPYQGLPIKDAPKWPHFWKPGVFQMTMGLKKLDPNNWLTFDSEWEAEHRQKLEWVNGKMRDEVVRILPGADDSCEELLQIVVAYITKRFPCMFQLEGNDIHIVPTGERYRIKAPYERRPMELVGLLAMDDFYILHKGEMDLYYLRACFLACPLGWALRDRIGWPLHQIHGPVPLWRERLQKSMEKFFLNLKVDAPIQRYNGFIQPEKALFKQEPFGHKAETIDEVHVRAELQSLRRLPRTGALVFTVRTHLNPITSLKNNPEALDTLWDATRNYPERTSIYKVKHLWNHVFEPFCQEVLEREMPACSKEASSVNKDNKEGPKPPPVQTCPAGFN